jgi:hypothetical protein
VNIADMRVVVMGRHTVGVLVHPASEASTEASNEQPDASGGPISTRRPVDEPSPGLCTQPMTRSGIDNAD